MVRHTPKRGTVLNPLARGPATRLAMTASKAVAPKATAAANSSSPPKAMITANNLALFNNPLFSDITIKQTFKGVTKEYHAHKAILSINSKWFRNAFTGNFVEAQAKTVELHDDDPFHFEVMLKLLYGQPLDLQKFKSPSEAKADHTIIDVDEYDSDSSASDSSGPEDIPIRRAYPTTKPDGDVATVLGVYAVADKYEAIVVGGMAAAKVVDLNPFSRKSNHPMQPAILLGAHYRKSFEYNGAMGRALCEMLAEEGHAYLEDVACKDLALECPNFAADMFLACWNEGLITYYPK